MSKTLTRWKFICASLFLAACASTAVFAQQTFDYAAEREKSVSLVNEKKYAEALPILEKLAADKRADGQIFLGLGLTYWQLQDTKKNKNEWKQIRLKARDAFLKAKELDVSVPEIDLLVASIKPDGGDKGTSDNPQAQAAMEDAFPAFAGGDYQKAAAAYEKAATLDPSHYEAALYAGNSYYAMKKYDNAGIWFAKAIAIDPNRETAYRYWADGLAASGKNKDAEDKYLDAVIAEPFNSISWRGLLQYGQQNNLKLAHPKIVVPVEFAASANGNTKITLGNFDDKSGDGSFAWTVYGISRAVWQPGKDGKSSEKFVKAFPDAKTYRHSLPEEMDALHSVVSILKEKKDIKNPEQSLVLLKKLDDDGLLEAYILFARSDAEVRQDYSAYRLKNRDKLKRYLNEYVMKGGNK